MTEPIPIRPSQPSEVEAKLLGAILDLADPLGLFEGCGLSPADFADARVRLAWGIARRLAEARREVSAITVFSAGKTARVMDDGVFAWLQQLQATNALSRDSFQLVAGDLRTGVRGRAVANKLEQVAISLREGRMRAAEAVGELEGLQFLLASGDLQTETAAGDIIELLDSWDHREKTGARALLPTGIKSIDDVIGGWDYKLNVVAGQPGAGKNAFIGASMRAQLEGDPKLRLGLFGLEDGTQWFTKRMVAQSMSMSVRDVGSKQRTPEQIETLTGTVAPEIHRLLERLHVYRRDEIKVDDWILTATHWVRNLGVGCIYLDNIGQMDHRSGTMRSDDQRMAVGRTVKAFARFANRHQVPVVVLAHTTRAADDGERPPKMSEIAESAYVERRARKIIGLWVRNRQLRATVLKDQEGGGGGTTIELERFTDAALVDPAGGAQVDLRKEARQARAEKEADSDARILERAERRAKLKASKEPKPAEPVAPAPQMTLLDAPGEKPQEDPRQ